MNATKNCICLLLFLSVCAILFCTSCRKQNIIISFDPMSNFNEKNIVKMDLDMSNSVFEGLFIPKKDSAFVFSFTIKPKDNEKYYYKIFYQNSSYAYSDDDKRASENFYGSWEETSTTFKAIKNNSVKDSFSIVGNPRNELKYFGDSIENYTSWDDINQIEQDILKDSNWTKKIREKAKQENEDIKTRMYKDAIWTLKYKKEVKKNVNHRQRRNPRMGEYEFMLVVVSKKALKKIPPHIKDISKTDKGEFVNPFTYFRKGQGSKMNGVYTFISQKKLKVRAKYDLSKGVYINQLEYPNDNFKVQENNPMVSNSDSLFKYAQFEQYFHNINTQRFINQIQAIEDIYSTSFDIKSYEQIAKDNIHNRKRTHPTITSVCGSTIRCKNNTISLINPGNKNIESAKKENVGIRARVGFTYGTYIFKMKFPPILNSNGIPNGLTNAAWLIYQSENEWNYRRQSKTGYVQNNYNENETQRIPFTHYSEIDIEMIKCSKYWPTQQWQIPKSYNPKTNKNIVFASTNWDLAENDNGFIKAKHLFFDYKYKGKEYYFNRWNETYRAITCKEEISNDIFLKPYYYYVIKWTPTEIIWYCGEDMEHLQVMCYMNDSFTNIPNNQMLPIVTQEYHYSDYWPPVIFNQENIPYASKDAIGTLYELIVE